MFVWKGIQPPTAVPSLPMSDDSNLGKVWRPLAADIRQAIVGWVVLLAIPLVAALILTVLVGDVPAWTLAVVVIVAVLLVAAISIEHRRELGRVEGSLALEKERRENIEAKLSSVQSNPSGEPILSGIQRGLQFRIQALRGELEKRRHGATSETTPSQDRAIRNLARDVGKQLEESEALTDIVNEWDGVKIGRRVDDGLTALGQLEGMTISASHH